MKRTSTGLFAKTVRTHGRRIGFLLDFAAIAFTICMALFIIWLSVVVFTDSSDRVEETKKNRILEKETQDNNNAMRCIRRNQHQCTIWSAQ